MTSGSTTSEGQRVPAGVNRRDVAVAVAVVLLGVVVIGLALRVEPGVQTDPLGPRAFPLALGGAIVPCGLLLGIAAPTGDRWTVSTAMFVESADDDASEAAVHSPWRLVLAVAATAAYLLLFERLGYLLVPGGTLSFVRAVGGRLHSAQISDNRGRIDEHLTTGEGTIDFGRVFRALRGIGFAGPLVIELFDVPKKLRSHRRLLELLAGRPRVARRARRRPRRA